MLSTENTFYAMSTLAKHAFPCVSPTTWRDDPVEATQHACVSLGLFAPTDALQNAILNSILLSGRWALSAFPVFQLTHRLAATLMATTISEDALEGVRSPFYAVTVKLPPDLIYIADKDERPESAILLTFSSYPIKGETRWSYCLSTNPVPIEAPEDRARKDGLSVWAFHIPQSEILNNDLPRTWNTLPRSSMDDRADALARRLMLGLCLWCSDPKNLGEPQRPSKSASRQRGRQPGELPDFKTWFLGKDISLDARVIEAVRGFSREGGSSPKVQSLVSGHWKQQAHGPGRTERKLIHVEPYWRGPLDAPIVSHGGR